MDRNEKVFVIVAIPTVIVIIIVAFLGLSLIRQTTRFTIIDDNGDLGVSFDKNFEPIYTYTVYVKIKNIGSNGTKRIYCEITNWDLSICKKTKNLFLEANQERTITFFFSNEELHSDIPKEYKVWFD